MNIITVKMLQFLEYYVFIMTLMVLTGSLIVWDFSYINLAVWDIEPRACVVVLAAFAGLINIFRTDNKVLLVEIKVSK